MRWSRAGLRFFVLSYVLGFLLPFHSRITLARVKGPPRARWHHVSSGAFAHKLFFGVFFFDWNTHFVVFSGGVEQGLGGPTARSSRKTCQNGAGRLGGFRVFLTGIPTSSFFLAASNRGWEARRPDLAKKFPKMGAWRLGGLIQLV